MKKSLLYSENVINLNSHIFCIGGIEIQPEYEDDNDENG
jgi:hypothetical protein